MTIQDCILYFITDTAHDDSLWFYVIIVSGVLILNNTNLAHLTMNSNLA